MDRKNQEEVKFKLRHKGGKTDAAFQGVKSAYVQALKWRPTV